MLGSEHLRRCHGCTNSPLPDSLFSPPADTPRSSHVASTRVVLKIAFFTFSLCAPRKEHLRCYHWVESDFTSSIFCSRITILRRSSWYFSCASRSFWLTSFSLLKSSSFKFTLFFMVMVQGSDYCTFKSRWMDDIERQQRENEKGSRCPWLWNQLMNGENNIMLDTLFSAYFRLIKIFFFFFLQDYAKNKISLRQNLVVEWGTGLHKNTLHFAVILEKGADPRMLISGACRPLAEKCALLCLLMFLIHWIGFPDENKTWKITS